jgi:hypothetical protein
MPWTASEAHGHTHAANTKAKRKKWAAIATGLLKKGKSEASAIKIANAAMHGDDLFYNPVTGREWSEKERRKRRKSAKDPFENLTAEYTEVDSAMRENLFQMLGDAEPELVHISMADTIELDDAAKVTFTQDGYLKAMPRIARTGIQIYSGDECGCPERERVRVYRPVDSVFHNDAVKTYTHLPMTFDHPSEPVTPANWKKYAIGDTGDEVLRDGGTVRVPMMLRDAAAIKAFKDGTNQLSVGYTCDLLWDSGCTDDGEEYDAVQTNIRANHLAVVAAARGGPTLKIGDDTIKPQETTMQLKSVVVDGITCEMTDIAAALVQKTIKGLSDALENMKKKKEEECEDSVKKITELTTAANAKDAQIVTLTKQLADAKLTPQQLDALVKDRQAVFDKAKKILGDKFHVDGKSIEDVRREVVNAKVGDGAKGWDDKMVEASFNTLVANAPASGTVSDAVRVFAGRPGNGYQQMDTSNPQQVRDAAYARSVFDMETAWMSPDQRAAAAAARGIQL